MVASPPVQWTTAPFLATKTKLPVQTTKSALATQTFVEFHRKPVREVLTGKITGV